FMPIGAQIILDLTNDMRVAGKSVCPHCCTESPLACDHCGNDILTVKIEVKSSLQFCRLHCSLCSTGWSCDGFYSFARSDWNGSLKPFGLEETEQKAVVRCLKCHKRVPFIRYSELWKSEGIDPEQRIWELAEKKRVQTAKEEALAKERAISGRAKAIEFIRDLTLVPALILDSNIWMNPGYDPLFQALEDCLKAAHGTLTLYGPQFDEICNVKRKTAYGTPSNRGARCALNRIERMQTSNRLNIEPLSIDAEFKVYADPLIVKLIVTQTKQGTAVAFLSDDMELRIRVRGLASKGPGKLRMIEGKDLLPMCRGYGVGGGGGVDDIDIEKCYTEMAGNDEQAPKSSGASDDDDDDDDDDPS
ncbi:MAG: hypothetical protein ORN83_06720, partial [Chthoniobacteraceae bacterium]|nr:hypothetical protein [Chthoniobacteraceae bacterium]